MEEPKKPKNEKQRLNCLLSTGLLDTPPDERFDRITRLTQAYFHVPITMVSLVDKERQWFKSRIGMELNQTPRSISFCGHAILGNHVFCVPDAHLDIRFHDNPLVVGPPKIRFYAGMPLAGYDGSNIGTLCIVDTSPHEITSDDIAVMRDLADCVESEIALVHAKNTIEKYQYRENRLRGIIDAISEGELILDSEGIVVKCSPVAEGILNSKAEEVVGKHVSALTPIDLSE